MCLRIGPVHLVFGSGRWETFQKSTMCGRVRKSEKKNRGCVGKEAGNLSTKLMMRRSCSWYTVAGARQREASSFARGSESRGGGGGGRN